MFRFLILSVLALSSSQSAFGQKDMTVRRNLIYAKPEIGPQRKNMLDVYSPAAGENLPVVVFIHGGGWKIGDKRAVNNKPQGFTQQGYVFVSVSYRLFPVAGYDDQAGDLAKAVKWVTQNITKHKGNPERMLLMGHSAGAHLAALLATDDRYLKQQGLTLKTIKGVVLLDGAGYDIPRQVQELGNATSRKMYETIFGSKTEEQKNASPITHVAPGKQIPPFLLLHVSHRRDARLQAVGLAEKLKAAGVSAQVIAARGKTHLTINRELGLKEDAPTEAVFEFYREVQQNLQPGCVALARDVCSIT